MLTSQQQHISNKSCTVGGRRGFWGGARVPRRLAGQPPTTGGPRHGRQCPRCPGCLWQMPQLSTRHLRGREELHLAHLVLSFITMGYLWQEGEEGTVKVTATWEQVHSLLGMWGLMLLPRDSSRGAKSLS